MKGAIRTVTGTYIVDPTNPGSLRFVAGDSSDPKGTEVNPVWVRQELARRRRQDPEYMLGELAHALNVPLVETGRLNSKHLPADHPDRTARAEATTTPNQAERGHG